MNIAAVLDAKDRGREVVSISPDAGVRELLALLAERNVGAVVVSRDGRTLDGISRRELARQIADPDLFGRPDLMRRRELGSVADVACGVLDIDHEGVDLRARGDLE